MNEIEVVLPAVDDGYVASGLYELSKALGQRDPDAQHYGFLGGEWGYGQDFANETFEMFPFWWGDCECGHDESEAAWHDANPHADDCYQAELERRGAFDFDAKAFDERKDVPRHLAVEWGLPEYGCMVHCTCGQGDRSARWSAENTHDERCPSVRPNFRHFASGFEVRWYKYIGRSMELSRDVTAAEWGRILDECLTSLASSESPDKETRSGGDD